MKRVRLYCSDLVSILAALLGGALTAGLIQTIVGFVHPDKMQAVDFIQSMGAGVVYTMLLFFLTALFNTSLSAPVRCSRIMFLVALGLTSFQLFKLGSLHMSFDTAVALVSNCLIAVGAGLSLVFIGAPLATRIRRIGQAPSS